MKNASRENGGNARTRTLVAFVTTLALASAAVAGIQRLWVDVPTAHATPERRVLEQSIKKLTESQAAVDALPKDLASGERALSSDLDRKSTRAIGSSKGVRYWVGVRQADGTFVCLIAALPGQRQLTAMSCASADRFRSGGLTLQASDKATSVEAFLLPDGYAASLDERDGFRKLGTNLVVSNPFDKDEAVVTLTSPGGEQSNRSSSPPKQSLELQLPGVLELSGL